jgi:V/A-type H+-transporting ATPase subunit E
MAKPKTADPEATSSGVEALIARLKDDGVQAGRQEADQIVEEARDRAETTLAEARAEAGRIVEEAREEAARQKTAADEAVKVAMRDTTLRFREEIRGYLNDRVRRLVSEEMVDRELLQKLILQVAARSIEAGGVANATDVEVQLPPRPLGIEELKNKPKALKDALSRLAKQIAGETWRDGVALTAGDETRKGLRVVVKDKELEIDLTPEALAELLLEHLQPRFRALMQGIIQ